MPPNVAVTATFVSGDTSPGSLPFEPRQGMRVEMDSLSTLFGESGVSFDILKDWTSAKKKWTIKTEYHRLTIRRASGFSLYRTYRLRHVLQRLGSRPAARRASGVRGIHLGTVGKVPFFIPGLKQRLNDDYRIPVEVRVEPQRLN